MHQSCSQFARGKACTSHAFLVCPSRMPSHISICRAVEKGPKWQSDLAIEPELPLRLRMDDVASLLSFKSSSGHDISTWQQVRNSYSTYSYGLCRYLFLVTDQVPVRLSSSSDPAGTEIWMCVSCYTFHIGKKPRVNLTHFCPTVISLY